MGGRGGDFITLRNRRWLVESDSGTSMDTLRLTCIDDDASGEPLTVVADAEIGHRSPDVDPWLEIGKSGIENPEAFRAYVRSLTWRTSTACCHLKRRCCFRA